MKVKAKIFENAPRLAARLAVRTPVLQPAALLLVTRLHDLHRDVMESVVENVE